MFIYHLVTVLKLNITMKFYSRTKNKHQRGVAVHVSQADIQLARDLGVTVWQLIELELRKQKRGGTKSYEVRLVR